MLSRRQACLVGTALVLVREAFAQSPWPERAVRILIGYPPGGPTDFAGRLLQEPLQRRWGQPVVIENRPGASQIIASEAVARAPADGYTLLLAASTHTSNPATHARIPYDTLHDFTPIVNLYTSPTVLLVPRASPFRSVEELVEAARRQPGMAFATSGHGSSGHFITELFRQRVGIEVTVVSFRGAAPALQEVLGGRIPATFSTLAGAVGLVREGALRPLAIVGSQRSEILPDVPALDELGMSIPDRSPWYGLIGPRGVPRPIVLRIATDAQEILRDPGIVRRIAEAGGRVLAEGPEVFADRIRAELESNIAVARLAGIRPE